MIISQEMDKLEEQLSEMTHRLYDIEEEMQKASARFPGCREDELLRLIRDTLFGTGMTQKDLAERVSCTRPAMSLYLRGKRKMPMQTMTACLDALGYKLVVLPVALPFTPDDDDINGNGTSTKITN